MKADFKPIHFFDHSTNESFQIVTREGLINWINDYTENHNAFDTFQELKERCLNDEEVSDAWDVSAQWIKEDKKENPQRYEKVSDE